MTNNLSTLLQFGKQYGKSFVLPWRPMSLATNPKEMNKFKPKTGILMLNMGGPTTIEQVHDYLLRIMTDRDMIQLPVQSQLGPWIAKRRTPEVQKKYAEIGGGSPILKWTNIQGSLMCKQLDNISPETAPHKYYVAFRYADPITENTLQELEQDGLEHTIIFSQYPQYSCATTGSSLNAIYKYYKKRQLPLNMKWSIIDRWATHPLFIKTIAERIKEELVQFPMEIRHDVIILFSAHSLPLKAVNRGDSYPSEIGATVALVMQELNYCNPYNLVWQSKVGPLPWLAPFTDDALRAYVKQGKKNFILVPVAFVNEHIETLHEMDIEYCTDLAKELGIEKIRRASAPNDHPMFIDALTDIVLSHLKSKRSINPKFLTRCPHCVNKTCLSSKNWYAKTCTS
ncbi:ferrochelatase, mitochondrial isoform X1 [Nomia melanderi]|uniref:ferrochelatase, mitochondrial isoform X1 n=1 Tax=Nomia melanderi TaxID=2448451 RepID=UPI00130457BF|nr:ferrochelatase, mitochondrial [Nomia melanderi]XP_031841165.1 ferrochelatase, mitochondrial [Nomia melanderi]